MNISKNKTSNFLYIGIIAILISSCDFKNRTHFKLLSPDKKQCVTFITNSNTRYIINGDHNSIPASNFIKINIAEIDPIGDEIGICWKKGNYEWEMVNHQSKIIENRLDTLKYKFNTSWETDERGIPNAGKYHQPKCETMDIESMEFHPNTGKAILEY